MREIYGELITICYYSLFFFLFTTIYFFLFSILIFYLLKIEFNTNFLKKERTLFEKVR